MQNGGDDDDDVLLPTKEEQSLRRRCLMLDHAALTRLIARVSLYLHPVIREGELENSATIRDGSHDGVLATRKRIEKKHIEEAELRSVYTIFIKPLISPNLVGVPELDQELYNKFQGIMKVVSRELDQYSGHFQQFIVDDKGMPEFGSFVQIILCRILLTSSLLLLKALYCLPHLASEGPNFQICELKVS